MPILQGAHYRQQQQADCLAACASMALTHLNIDPAFADAPQQVDRVLFESAWLRRDYVYALILPKQ